METLSGVLEQWNEAMSATGEASPDNQARMNAWLNVALRSVMPGGSGKLPAAPRFEKALRFGKEVPRVTPAPQPATKPIAATPIPKRPTQARRPLQVSPTRPTRITQKPTPPTVVSPRSASPFAGPRLTVRSPGPKTVYNSQPAIVRSKPTPAPRPRLATPVEPQDPFADDPNASPNPLRLADRRVAQRPASPKNRSVGINLSQLVAEVRGYNAALRELQARVMRLNDDDVLGLSQSADLLDQLDEKRQFLDLYRGGLSRADQNSVPSSPSPELIRELVRRKTIDLIRQTPPERRAERRVLERLNDRLARQGRTASIKF